MYYLKRFAPGLLARFNRLHVAAHAGGDGEGVTAAAVRRRMNGMKNPSRRPPSGASSG